MHETAQRSARVSGRPKVRQSNIPWRLTDFIRRCFLNPRHQAPDNIGVSQVGHSDHCGQPASQQPEIDAFIKKFLLGQSVDTKINKTNGTYTFDQEKWVDWSVPTLK